MSTRIDGDLPRRPRFEVRLAETSAEIRATQRLRYEIFAGELGAAIDGGDAGLDHDQYDPFCRHLMVCEAESGRIVACTRILTGERAPGAGGFYSADEFDLAMLDSLPGRVMEIGRTCVAPEYRSGAVIATLWQGIAAYIVNHGYDYLFGCASIDLRDGGASAHAILDQIRNQHLAPPSQRVRPYIPLPAADRRATEKTRMPPLLKAYLSLGAKACGEAYWDRDFNCADVFMLLDVRDLNPRYARHFLGQSAGAVATSTETGAL
ncbi:GNAT family N-acetyltransferase [Solimonas terrae]|uniref:L-ornithine N(alpha)-acyltransferase n=1 Tax=Solimonas terrae TaxID=1396819 RepID=A0A6M2BV54_9GAMM|nr:GNAT family N-acyltransferase [Solimonas terrae]NGY05827.1 GNAT family N-acetyltransferase [Solimonas terrae]